MIYYRKYNKNSFLSMIRYKGEKTMITKKRSILYLFLSFSVSMLMMLNAASNIKKLDETEWSKKLKENQGYPYTILKAKYGHGKKTIDVTSKLQEFANRGTFPDLKKLGSNNFFGTDPIKGKSKNTEFEATMKEFSAWTKSMPPLPQGMPKVITYLVNISENAKNLSIPTEIVRPLSNIQEPNPSAAPTTETSVHQDPTGILNPVISVDLDTLKWPASGVITIQQIKDIIILNNHEKFTINEAWYGIKDQANSNTQNSFINVKEKMQQGADKGTLLIPDNMNQFFSKDPSPGVKKQLFIDFTMGGTYSYKITIPEHKEDRGTYDLPVSRILPDDTTIWFENLDIRGIVDSDALKKLSFSDRIKNLFSLFKNKGSGYDKTILSELNYIATNQDKASENEKSHIPALFRNGMIRFKESNKEIKALNELIIANKISFESNDLLLQLRGNLDWDTSSQDDNFLIVAQDLLTRNQENKLSQKETLEFKGILFAAETLNRDSKYKETIKKIKDIADKVTLPAAPASTPSPAAGPNVAPTQEKTIENSTAVINNPTSGTPTNPDEIKLPEKAPEELTFADKLQALTNIVSFADAAAKTSFLDNLEKLILARASASADQLSQIQDLLSYYGNISSAFKNDADLKKRLDGLATTFNSGIVYKDRLAAADSLIKASSISDKQKSELFGILKALATEQAKGNQAEISLARAYLIMAQKQFTGKTDTDTLAQIEIIFNTPPAPTITPEKQAQIASVDPIKSIETIKATVENKNQEVTSTNPTLAQATSVVAEAKAIADPAKATTIPASPAADAPYGQKVAAGFPQILALQMQTPPAKQALDDASNMLSDLVANQQLGSDADITMLNSLLSYAASTVSNKEFEDKVKELAKTMGTPVDFSAMLKYFNTLITDKGFASSTSKQKSAMTLAQKIVQKFAPTATLDQVANLKASLIAAQGLFVSPEDKAAIQKLQESVVVPAVSSAPLPATNTKAPESTAIKFSDRVASVQGFTNFFSANNRSQFMEALTNLIADRPRGTDKEISDVLVVVNNALKVSSFSTEQNDKLKGFAAILSRPATINEQTDEMAEMATLNPFETVHNIELLGIMDSLSKNISTIDANSLTRIKATLLTLVPKINKDYLDAFNKIKAIFDAPVQIVAPVAAIQTGQAPAPAVVAAAPVASAATIKVLSEAEKAQLQRQLVAKTNMKNQMEAALNNSRLDPIRKANMQKSYDETVKTIETIKAQLASGTSSSTPGIITPVANLSASTVQSGQAPVPAPRPSTQSLARPTARAIIPTSRTRTPVQPTIAPSRTTSATTQIATPVTTRTSTVASRTTIRPASRVIRPSASTQTPSRPIATSRTPARTPLTSPVVKETTPATPAAANPVIESTPATSNQSAPVKIDAATQAKIDALSERLEVRKGQLGRASNPIVKKTINESMDQINQSIKALQAGQPDPHANKVIYN